MDAPTFFRLMFDPFRRLFDFSGRSTRSEFWPFIFLMYAVSQVGTMLVIGPVIKAAQDETIVWQPDQVNPNLFLDLFQISVSNFIIAFVAPLLIFALPLASSATRRLHDTNRSGWWAVPTAILLISGFYFMSLTIREIFDSTNDIPSSFIYLFVNNLLYLVTLIVLIVFWAQDGTIGTNDYGNDPKGRDPV